MWNIYHVRYIHTRKNMKWWSKHEGYPSRFSGLISAATNVIHPRPPHVYPKLWFLHRYAAIISVSTSLWHLMTGVPHTLCPVKPSLYGKSSMRYMQQRSCFVMFICDICDHNIHLMMDDHPHCALCASMFPVRMFSFPSIVSARRRMHAIDTYQYS